MLQAVPLNIIISIIIMIRAVKFFESFENSPSHAASTIHVHRFVLSQGIDSYPFLKVPTYFSNNKATFKRKLNLMLDVFKFFFNHSVFETSVKG